jgi:hypothetical protein
LILSLQAADSWSTAHICVAIVKLCGDLQQWKLLNDQIHLIAKRRAQLKKVGLESSAHFKLVNPIVNLI